MKGTILITDSLFISSQNEEQIRAAGYDIERLDNPSPTEDDLSLAIKGKVGYILGGAEQVTQKVIDAADALKVIAFTGTGYKDFIPAWEYAGEKGIAITKSPDGHTQAVAEWAIGAAILMNRDFLGLGKFGDQVFQTTAGLEDQHVGIIGLGKIGGRISEMISVFHPASISYYSRTPHPEKEAGPQYKPLESILRESDIIFVCVSREAGDHFLSKAEFSHMKSGSLLVSFMKQGIIDETALLDELKSGRIRAISDYPPTNPEFNSLPVDRWYANKSSNAFNTKAGIDLTSNTTTRSLLNVLESGSDEFRVV